MPAYKLPDGINDTLVRRFKHLCYCASLAKSNFRDWQSGQKIRCIRDPKDVNSWTEPQSAAIQQASEEYKKFRDCETDDMPDSQLMTTATTIDNVPQGRRGGVPASLWTMEDEFSRPPKTEEELLDVEDVGPKDTPRAKSMDEHLAKPRRRVGIFRGRNRTSL